MDIKNWLTHEKDLDLSHLEIFNFEKTGRGVKATRDILENEEIISIPYEILITKDFCTKNVEELKKWIYFLAYVFLNPGAGNLDKMVQNPLKLTITLL